jgi:hypothetical protein
LGGWSADTVAAAPVPADKPVTAIVAAPAPRPQPASLLQPNPAPHIVVVTVPARSEAAPLVPQSVVGPGSDPAALARDLQRELRRVGCYGGEMTGVWTTSSRRAMKAFTDRVNAALPVDTPDPILLSLVRAHPGDACGKPCPARETLAEDGRCVPTAVLAHVARKGATPPELARPAAAVGGWTTAVSAAPPAAALPPPPGRMALAGPRAAEAAPGLAAGETERGPLPAAQAAKAKPPRAAKVRRDDRRHVQRVYPPRSRFVETFVRNFLWN